MFVTEKDPGTDCLVSPRTGKARGGTLGASTPALSRASGTDLTGVGREGREDRSPDTWIEGWDWEGGALCWRSHPQGVY